MKNPIAADCLIGLLTTTINRDKKSIKLNIYFLNLLKIK